MGNISENERKSIMTTINILVVTDKNYIPLTNVLLTSLFDNNTQCTIVVHLMHSSLTDEDLIEIRQVVEKNSGTLQSYQVKAEHINTTMDESNQGRLPEETYYRLLCMSYLPVELDRVLYLDCDIIINGSLEELYNTDLTNYLFAAAYDFIEAMSDVSEDIKKLKNNVVQYMTPGCKYVNAGVLLINLAKLREVLTTEKIVSMIDEIKGILVHRDQDFLNFVFGEQICYVDYKLYNYFPLYWHWDEVKTGQPVIFHFAGRIRPWKDGYFEMLEPYIEAYRGKTRLFVKQAKELYEHYKAMSLQT